MNAQEFVDSLKSECRDAAVSDCTQDFLAPPGRRPAPALLEMAAWFGALSEKDRSMVVKAMREAADATLFGVLCVLDGARAIEGQGEKTTFRVIAEKGGESQVLCPGDNDLHELL